MLHLTQLLANLSERELAALASEYSEVSEIASQNLPAILAQAPELEATRLESLGIEVEDFALISDYLYRRHSRELIQAIESRGHEGKGRK